MQLVKRAMLIMLIIVLVVIAGLLTFYLGISSATPQRNDRISIENRNQVKRIAEMYLEEGNYSEEGLVAALRDYEWCDEGVAREAVNSMDIDWQAQADEELEAYLNMTGNSEEQVREYLKRDKFTDEQINKAIANKKPDWRQQAKICADYLRSSGIDDKDIDAALLERGFRQEELP